MRKRNIDKHIWFSRDEAQELQKKAKKACLFLRPEKSELKWQ